MIVVDCAAVVDTLTLVEGSSRLRAELGAEDLHAPSLLDFEVVSVVRGLVRGGKLSVARAHDTLNDYDALRVQRWSSGPALRRRAFEMRDNLTAYDAAYVALAEALECPLMTRDERLARSAGALVDVRVR